MQKEMFTDLPAACSARERDYQLAHEVLVGNQSAWDALYLDSFNFVVNGVKYFDYRHFFAPCDYYDITDEAFARCYEHLERYQGLGRFQRWVLGYAKNIMRNRRSMQLTAKRNQNLLKDMAASHAAYLDPLRFLIRLERDQFLWAAFHQLNFLDQIICTGVSFSIHRRVNSRENFS